MRLTQSRKGGAKLGITFLLIAIAVGAYFVIPAFNSWVNDWWNKVKDWLGQHDITFTVEIFYADGTSKLYTPSGMFPENIYDWTTGVRILKIRVQLIYTMTVTGTVQSWHAEFGRTRKITNLNYQDLEILDNNVLTVVDSAPEGQSTVIWSEETTEAQLQSYYPYAENTQYKYAYIVPSVTMTVTFDDYTVDTKTSSQGAVMYWTFKWGPASGINSLSIEWRANISS